MKLMPHLHFRGNCREAFNQYAELLGGRVAFAMTFGEAPGEHPAALRGQIIHARVEFAGQALTGCDAPPERYERPQGFNLLLDVASAADGERIFNELARGGQLVMPFAQTFWAHRFGMCSDRFGIPWMVNCEKP
ncbi:MAG: VOC family protein [Proteobacteria bacterium]|nr:VOC family protein [Pseudomonadota bacterium]